MGGMVAIAARYTNGEVVKFKTSTNFFDYQMNAPHLINEEHFKQKVLEHNLLRDDSLPEEEFENYDSRKSILAPYDYGIILLDYAKNTILSCNDYNATIRGSSAKLLDEYKKFIVSDFILKVTDINGNTKNTLDIRENRFMDIKEVHQVYTAIRNNAVIKCKGVEVQHNGTIESVLKSIYGIYLDNQSKEDKLQLIKQYEAEEAKRNNETYGNPYRSSLGDYADISFEYLGFNIIECDNDNEHGIIYQYLQDNGFILTDTEHLTWKEYIAEKLKRYEAEMDREIDFE